MYHTVNTNYIGWAMHALTMAQGGHAREAPSSGLKLSSLTGPWIWDIVGLRKMKRALMRSSMRAAQGPWLRDEIIAPGMLGTGGHGPGSQAFEPTHTINQPTSQGLKLQARGHKLQDPGTRVQAHKLRIRGSGNKDK